MKKKWISLIITGSFLLLVGWFSFSNYPVLKLALTAYGTMPDSVKSLSVRLTDAMKSDELFHKDELITLNGLYGRLTDRHLYNNVIRMKNGMLNYGITELKPKAVKITEALSDLNVFVEEQGGKFLYVQFPGKYDKENLLMPDGLSMQIPKEITGLLDDIRKTGVDVLDVQPPLSTTVEDIEENYYRTDHHWKPSAAMKGTRLIMEHLQKLFPEENLSGGLFDDNRWTIHEMTDQFLGSMGRRVGPLFSGVDDLEWLTPNFETDLSFYCPDPELFFAGDYETAFVRDIYLEPGLNKMRADNYFVYVGDNYPLVRTRNLDAPSEKKVLLLHDSYCIPVITYLSLAFREVNSIDTRYYEETSVKEFINWNRPDIVIMALSPYPNVIDHDNLFVFSNGYDRFLSGQIPVLDGKNLELQDGAVLLDGFENEQVYSLHVPHIRVTDGNVKAVFADLYDPINEEIVSGTVMEPEYCSAYGDCEWIFRTPVRGSENLQLRFRYEESDAAVMLDGVTLFQMEMY